MSEPSDKDARDRALVDAVRKQLDAFAVKPVARGAPPPKSPTAPSESDAPTIDARRGSQRAAVSRAAAFIAAGLNGDPPATVAATLDAGATRISSVAVRTAEQPAIEFDGYDVLGELSRGGQGVVYRATQHGTKREVAIKVLLDGAHASPATRARFEREVQLAAKLRHPNIITIFHSGTTGAGLSYYVMDFVPGMPLHRYVRERQLALDEVLRIFAVISDAVQYAHQRGVIHRDLKPSNILIDQDGAPKVLDFGLAKSMSDDHAALTMTQEVMGTLPYMSPEQTRGKPDEIDTRTDVYALGVILYELLTGHYPYRVVGNLVDVLKNITSEPPKSPAKSWDTQTGVTRATSKQPARGTPRCPINDEVETIVLRALAKDADRRYQSAGDLARDVRHFLTGEAIEAKRDSKWYVLRKWAAQNRATATVTVSVLVIIFAFSNLGWWFWAEASRATRKSEAAQATMAANSELVNRKADTFALGVFLAALEMNAPSAARALLPYLADGTVQRRAARYILGDEITEQQLLAGLTEMEKGEAYFAIGYRLDRAGKREEAIRAFEDGLQKTPNGFWRTFMQARLTDLRRETGAVPAADAGAIPESRKTDGSHDTPR